MDPTDPCAGPLEPVGCRLPCVGCMGPPNCNAPETVRAERAPAASHELFRGNYCERVMREHRGAVLCEPASFLLPVMTEKWKKAKEELKQYVRLLGLEVEEVKRTLMDVIKVQALIRRSLLPLTADIPMELKEIRQHVEMIREGLEGGHESSIWGPTGAGRTPSALQARGEVPLRIDWTHDERPACAPGTDKSGAETDPCQYAWGRSTIRPATLAGMT